FVDPLGDAVSGGFEQIVGDVLVVPTGGVEVVAGYPERRHPAPDGLEQRVVAEVVDMGPVGRAGLEVDQKHPGLVAAALAEGEVDLAPEDDAPVAQLDGGPRLEDGPPLSLQGRETFEELGDAVGDVRAQLGQLGLAPTSQLFTWAPRSAGFAATVDGAGDGLGRGR